MRRWPHANWPSNILMRSGILHLNWPAPHWSLVH